MDITQMENNDASYWGVVYSYGGVLTVFENEQDAQNEAAGFSGAVVRIARSILSAIGDAGAVNPQQPI
ncbi:hypothetical protein [Stutzerimonas stutzeri]|uniref:hypothetical protein n=1 Tax=Stutzerimonas stutzeri TaxID=316 RepID=UPI001C2E8265|nr:hypothetical protein [Stutzerimonas stutzeri]